MSRNIYKLKAELWLYPGETANWHFVTIPKKDGEEIKKRFGANSRGWGSLPVIATIGKTSWRTSIFPDKRSGSYLLPIKADVRKKEGLMKGDTVSFQIELKPKM